MTLNECKNFKQLCNDAVFKTIKFCDYGYEKGKQIAYVVPFDEGHSIAISFEAYQYKDSADESEDLENNFHVKMTEAAFRFKNGQNYYYKMH